MNVLIVGSGAKEYTLAKLMKSYNNVDLVFVAPGNEAIQEFASCIDIKANDIDELLEFVKANEIDLTVACSEKAIEAGIADKFNDAGLMIFAPTIDAAKIAISKSAGKKFMYKTKIPTPKFGIFDRENMAVEYARKSAMPLLIKTDNHQKGENVVVCDSFKNAKRVIEEVFDSQNKKLVMEDYIPGQEFSYYVITDGYNAMPLTSVVPYKYSLNGDGGLVTSGMGAYSPFYMINHDIERRIFKEIIYPALDELGRNNNQYVGILGVDIILDRNGGLNVMEFNPFLKEPDAECVFALVNENFADLMRAAVMGTLMDIFPEIRVKHQYAVSVVLTAGNYPVSGRSGSVIKGLDEIDEEVIAAHYNTTKNQAGEYETNGGRTLSVTACGATLESASNKVYENIKLINFDCKKHRTDIGNVMPSRFQL